MGALDGRVAIVTGAADGPKAALGATFARELAAAGASVLAVDVLDTAPVVDAIRDAGGVAHGIALDLAKPDAAETMAAEARARFGRIDILVNNAALGSNTPPTGMDAIDVEDWDRLMAVNVRGPMLAVRAVVPDMAAAGYGKIVNLGSPMIINGAANRLHYVASKGAVHAMTRSMARELGPRGIRVNTLTPGLPDTAFNQEMMGPERMRQILGGRSIPAPLDPRAIARVLMFLASSDSDAMTGQEFVVDNGGSFV